MINYRLSTYMENGIMADTQNGFRSKRSCTEQVYILDSVIKQVNSNNKILYSCFIDLKKAFDYVDRDLLMLRLLQNKVDGKFYYAIKSLYAHPQYCVQVNNLVTDWFVSNNGVKQGDSLSPTLFSIYINDLLHSIENLNLGVRLSDELTVSILAYADDLVIFSDDPIKLQNLLDYVNSWCHKWRMEINVDKTKVVQFRDKKQNPTDTLFKINGRILEQVSSYKYLGVIMQENLDYSMHITTLSNAAKRALGKVIYKSKTLKGLGYQTYSKLYNSMVAPIMDYGSEIWGFSTPNAANKVHLMAQRYFMGVHRFAPVAAVAGDMGWLSVKDRWALNMTRFYNRLINTNPDRLLAKVFMFNKLHTENNNWCKNMCNILNVLDMDHLYENNTILNIQEVKNKLMENNQNDWVNMVDAKPKLRTYKLIKKDYKPEQYLMSNLYKYERSLLAQLRIGILPLHIETGRYVNLRPEERLCKICNNQEIEDEVHFLFHCETYTNERASLFDNINQKSMDFSEMNDICKLDYLMKFHVYAFGHYVKDIYTKRRKILYN